MILLRFIRGSGMGNQMFMYAAGLATANRLDTDMKFASWDMDKVRGNRRFYLDCFPNIKEPQASMKEVMNISPFLTLIKLMSYSPVVKHHVIRRGLIYVLTNFVSDKLKDGSKNILCRGMHIQGLSNDSFENIPDNTCIMGIWASEKFFEDIAGTVREKFKFAPECFNPELTEKIQSCNSIALHIRRGDKVGKDDSGASNVPYLRRAIGKILSLTENPVFFVLSDDIEWCRKTLSQIYDAEYYFIEGQTAEKDMALMTICRHVIAAPSTFSWWGAWLNESPGKIVIFPALYDQDDFLPESWIKL